VKKVFGMVLFILLFAVISACSNEEPVNEQTETTTTGQADEELSAPAEEEAIEETEDEATEETASAVDGSEVFQKSCITCHSTGDINGGQGKIDGAKIHSDFQTQEDLLAYVSENMPKSAPGSLSGDEYDAVVKYLWEQK
jgi:cytochrome c5